MRAACQSEDGDYLYPFIHVSFFPPPPSLKQASRSVNVLRALGPVQPVGSWSRETVEDNACFGWEESKWCATADRRPFPKPGLLFFFNHFNHKFSRNYESGDAFLALWFCFSLIVVLILNEGWRILGFTTRVCFTEYGLHYALTKAQRASTCLYEDGAVDTSGIFSVLNSNCLVPLARISTVFSWNTDYFFPTSAWYVGGLIFGGKQGNGKEITQSLHTEQGNIVRKKTIRAHREATEIALGWRYISENSIQWSYIWAQEHCFGERTNEKLMEKSWDRHWNSTTVDAQKNRSFWRSWRTDWTSFSCLLLV